MNGKLLWGLVLGVAVGVAGCSDQPTRLETLQELELDLAELERLENERTRIDNEHGFHSQVAGSLGDKGTEIQKSERKSYELRLAEITDKIVSQRVRVARAREAVAKASEKEQERP